MLPTYTKEKGMLIKGHYWLIHPKTGIKWTIETGAEFIESERLNEQLNKADSKLVAGVKKLAKSINIFKK